MTTVEGSVGISVTLKKNPQETWEILGLNHTLVTNSIRSSIFDVVNLYEPPSNGESEL